MSELNLVCLHFEECRLLPEIIPALHTVLTLPVNLGRADPDLKQFYNHERSQYDASAILAAFEKNNQSGKTILITSIDIYMPIFTFVFGLAKLNGRTGIVSVHRLTNEYYGLPADERLLTERLVKEITHELGHLFNLRHCPNYQCVMASSNTADELDIKGAHYCRRCQNIVESAYSL
jgi:archaemetzincin